MGIFQNIENNLSNILHDGEQTVSTVAHEVSNEASAIFRSGPVTAVRTEVSAVEAAISRGATSAENTAAKVVNFYNDNYVQPVGHLIKNTFDDVGKIENSVTSGVGFVLSPVMLVGLAVGAILIIKK
jgi:hypothetical protein